MCVGIMDPDDPRYSCDCHRWGDGEVEQDEEEPDPEEEPEEDVKKED